MFAPPLTVTIFHWHPSKSSQHSQPPPLSSCSCCPHPPSRPSASPSDFVITAQRIYPSNRVVRRLAFDRLHPTRTRRYLARHPPTCFPPLFFSFPFFFSPCFFPRCNRFFRRVFSNALITDFFFNCNKFLDEERIVIRHVSSSFFCSLPCCKRVAIDFFERFDERFFFSCNRRELLITVANSDY